jgi:hypothetical protein
LATSPRCGWFSGCARITCTVPLKRPSPSRATSTMRSPRAIESSTPRQKAWALSRDSGDMKLTDAPPSTQSSRMSVSAGNTSAVS